MSGAYGAAISVASQSAGAWISGVSTYKNSLKASQFALEDAELFRIESDLEATRIRDESNRFAKDQAMAYISSGVQAEGTALLVQLETVSMGEMEAKAVEFAGARSAERKEEEAKSAKRAGKAAMVSALFGSASSVGSYVASQSGGK